ncbi:unnamed protein product [Paramecium pentaurelia]|uniref:Transmembrane protein n=1 Tax=Paramecium pentaurelia TaxID=43138 RepID=A0A8S1VQL7_9CILI|nr:unnamed protein product [Paramecium pentaurelia]
MKQKYVEIVYQFNNKGHKSYIQAIYKIPEKESTNFAVLFYAAIQDVSYAYYLIFQTELYNKYINIIKIELYLISNLLIWLIKIIQRQLISKIVDRLECQQSQSFCLIENDYIERYLYLDITSSDDPGQSDNNGHTILWVILGIVGGLIVLGVRFWCGKKKQSKNEPLL